MFKYEQRFCNPFISLLRLTKNGTPGYNATYIAWSTKTLMLDAFYKQIRKYRNLMETSGSEHMYMYVQ